MLSIIIPTYNERENISWLIEQVYTLCYRDCIALEIIVVDDNSPDGTAEIVLKLAKIYSNLKLVQRSAKLGLSSAVVAGFTKARGEILAVMDADLSHSPNSIIAMYREITADNGPDFVIGSRYVQGAQIIGLSPFRRIISKAATVLVKSITSVKDPLSGFFLIKKKCIENVELNSQGFKIGLELLMKADYMQVKEVPIVFQARTKGFSKAGIHEAYFLLRNIVRYRSLKNFRRK